MPNISTEIRQNIEFNNIKFTICATEPQKYYNEMLLYTDYHYNTFILFEDKNLFKGCLMFSKFLNENVPDAKMIFNGNFDNFNNNRWHFNFSLNNTTY